MRISVLMYILLSFGNEVLAQQKPIGSDSITIYHSIQDFSKRYGITRFIYRIIFKPPATLAKKVKPKTIAYKPQTKHYHLYEGKVIRSVKIETLDPFGFSVTDTTLVPTDFFIRSGNKMHVKSQRVTIRNLLLFGPNDVFDSLLVNESERLIRTRGYVREVAFIVKNSSVNNDSVDIVIRELDKWSIVPRISFSKERLPVLLNDKNILGSGHEFNGGYTWYHTTGDKAFSIGYTIPNILRTYINTSVQYRVDEMGNFSKSFAVGRPFYSIFTKWAGGINYAQLFRTDSIQSGNEVKVLQNFKHDIQDYWFGNAMRIFKGNSVNASSTNFISAARFLSIRYSESPSDKYDSVHYFANEDFYLGGIGISRRKYVEDKFIFNYGITEDVPSGILYGLTGGYQIRNNIGRLYVGARVSVGNYYALGYMSLNFEYGSFFRALRSEQGVFSAGVTYFTKLIRIGRWNFRQFMKSQATIGLRRYSYEKFTMNDGHGIDGFNSSNLTGTNRLLLTLQSQSYAPFNFIGFHFGPFLAFSAGMLSSNGSGFRNSRVYTQLGLGVLIRNVNLTFNNFQISIAFYPMIPGNGKNVFKTNAFKTTDFGFRDFVIGKPSEVPFQ